MAALEHSKACGGVSIHDTELVVFCPTGRRSYSSSTRRDDNTCGSTAAQDMVGVKQSRKNHTALLAMLSGRLLKLPSQRGGRPNIDTPKDDFPIAAMRMCVSTAQVPYRKCAFNAGFAACRKRPSQVVAHRDRVVLSKGLLHLPSRGEIIRMSVVGLAKRLEEV
jgi:hypothetical protein